MRSRNLPDPRPEQSTGPLLEIESAWTFVFAFFFCVEVAEAIAGLVREPAPNKRAVILKASDEDA
jgi:hypothetical protein